MSADTELETLREENAGLRCRIDELEAERAEVETALTAMWNTLYGERS